MARRHGQPLGGAGESAGGGHSDSTSIHIQSILEKESDRLAIEAMLLGQNSLGQLRFRVVRFEWDRGLQDDRAVIGLKSSLVMQGESTDARAGALGQDHFKLGAARTLDEIAAAVDAVTFDRLNAYLAERRFGPFTLVSIGPGALTPPSSPPASGSLVEDALRS